MVQNEKVLDLGLAFAERSIRPLTMLPLRTTSLIFFMTMLVQSVSAEILVAEALIKVKGAGWEGTRITILPEFGEPYEIPMTSNRFELELGLQASYLIRAEHPECPTKEVFFDCRVPVLLESWDFEFPFEITLEKFTGDRSFTYSQPVGLVFFDTAEEDFAYSTDYSRIMNATSIVPMQLRMTTTASLFPGSDLGEVSKRNLSASVQSPETEMERLSPIPTTKLETRTIATIEPYAEVKGVLALKASVIPVTAPAIASSSRNIEPTTAEPTSAVPKLKLRPIKKASEVIVSSRAIYAPESRSSECGTHRFESHTNRVIIIDHVPVPDGCAELRKVVHSYGEVFYFQNGRAITEPVYNEVLAARRMD